MFFLSSSFPQVDGQIDSAIVRFAPFYHGEYMLTRHILLKKDAMIKIEHIVRAACGDSIHEQMYC
jgi:hypothetical protein